MLWALALLGLLPAAFTFSSDEDEEGEAQDNGSSVKKSFSSESENEANEGGVIAGDLFDDAFSGLSEVFGSEDDGDENAEHDVFADGMETSFPDFIPGEDSIVLHLADGGDGSFISESNFGADGQPSGVSLIYFDGSQETTLNFPNLAAVPSADIDIGIASAEAGAESLLGLDNFGDFGPLAPNDPDAPATPAGAGDDTLEVLRANDPELPDEAAGSVDESLEVLKPTSVGEETPDFVHHVINEESGTLVLHDSPFEGGQQASIEVLDGNVLIVADGTLHQVQGSAQSDTIATGDGVAFVDAGDGNDTVYVGEGAAVIEAGAGNDIIYGGKSTQNAYLYDGGTGDDTIHGGAADEVIIGGDGADRLDGGAGNDTMLMDRDDNATGGEGADTFAIDITSGSDGIAKISDFELGEDVLHLFVPSLAASNLPPDIVVTNTEDGASSQVSVDGEVVALLSGAPNVSAADVVVSYGP